MSSTKWSKEEDGILLQSKLEHNLGYGKISNILDGRTRNAVRHRWELLKNRILSGEKEAEQSDGPRILVFDIETSPLVVYSWGVYQQFINPDNVINDWYVISWAAKWLNSNEIISNVLTAKEAQESDDRRIVSRLWELFDAADIIIAHNCDRFDKRKMNWRFLIHGFPPPLSSKTIDTLKVARKYFSATSNKLDYLTNALSIGKKSETGGLDLWKDCMSGDKKALEKMLNYNINDILILERVYLLLQPWITNHPNLGLYNSDNTVVCPACGSTEIETYEKIITTAANAYYQYRCNSCSHVGRTKKPITTKDKRDNTLAN